MNKRILVPLALLVPAALTVTACGGGSSAEGKITETIEKATTTSDPSNCTELETRRFVEQNDQQKGKAAVEACEKEAEEGEEVAESAEVSNISVNGERATAEVAFEGGKLGSQALEVSLVEAEGDWKLDQIEGFAKYDGKALAEQFERQFAKENAELSPGQEKCITGKVGRLSQEEAEELFLDGSSEKAIELAEGCA